MLAFFDARVLCVLSVFVFLPSTPALLAAEDIGSQPQERRACEGGEGERLLGGSPILSRILELGGGDERILEMGAGDDGCEDPPGDALRWGLHDWIEVFLDQ